MAERTKPTPVHVAPYASQTALPPKLHHKSPDHVLQVWQSAALAWDRRRYTTAPEALASLPSQEPAPDQIIDRDSRIAALSHEARYVVGLILNTPSEILDTLLTPRTGRYSKKLLIRHLQTEQGWDREWCDTVLEEVHAYLLEQAQC